MDHCLKIENNQIIQVGKTFGHLHQSIFFREIYAIKNGPPPNINLVNEKNNGENVLKCIEKKLIESAYDLSVGGMLVGLAKMAMCSDLGIKINKPTKLSNSSEYFFGEDQGRYLIEVSEEKYEKVTKIFDESNVHYENVGKVQKDFFELSDEFKINIKELYNINNKWYYNY